MEMDRSVLALLGEVEWFMDTKDFWFWLFMGGIYSNPQRQKRDISI